MSLFSSILILCSFGPLGSSLPLIVTIINRIDERPSTQNKPDLVLLLYIYILHLILIPCVERRNTEFHVWSWWKQHKTTLVPLAFLLLELLYKEICGLFLNLNFGTICAVINWIAVAHFEFFWEGISGWSIHMATQRLDCAVCGEEILSKVSSRAATTPKKKEKEKEQTKKYKIWFWLSK